ncbi:MAG: ribokinase [Christensenellales bacterium]|jgi:ribokinase
MKKIAVIGSLNIDYVANVANFPSSGETVLSTGFNMVPGGKGANQAYALGRMGADVVMLGAVGDDFNGKIALEGLGGAGVDVSQIKISGEPTGLAMIAVNDKGENSIVVCPGANDDVTFDYIKSKADMLKRCDIIVFQLEIPLETVLLSAKMLKEMGKTIILDPAPAPETPPRGLISLADYIKPNESELAKLTGADSDEMDLDTACDKLLDMGAGCVLASLGSAGVMVKKKNLPGEVFPAQKVKAVDTTAAGDSFTAAVAYALSKNLPIEDAVIFANKVATLVVQRPGAQSSIPTREEMQKLWPK